MAKASVETVSTKVVTLSLTEAEAHAVFALVGAVASTVDSTTGDIYDALRDAIAEGFYGRYTVGDKDGGFLGTLYLTRRSDQTVT